MFLPSLLSIAFVVGVNAQGYDPLAVTRWKHTPERLDLFGLDQDDSGYHSIWHKFHNEHGWEPHGKFENLSRPDALLSPNRSAPVAVSWDDNHIDLFVVSNDGKPYHRYWSGSQWEPESWNLFLESEEKHISFRSKLAVAAWAPGRLDVVGHIKNGSYLHKYFDGADWSKWELLSDQEFASRPSIVSWGPNRFDIFGVDTKNVVQHIYWNGDSYRFESLHHEATKGFRPGSLTTSTWGDKTMALWAVGNTDSQLYYTFWTEHHYQPWTLLGGNFQDPPKVIHRAGGIIDLFGHSGLPGQTIKTKVYAGNNWYPSGTDWWDLTDVSWDSLPTVESWSDETIAVVGVNASGSVDWNYWSGKYWSGWNVLGDIFHPYSRVNEENPDFQNGWQQIIGLPKEDI